MNEFRNIVRPLLLLVLILSIDACAAGAPVGTGGVGGGTALPPGAAVTGGAGPLGGAVGAVGEDKGGEHDRDAVDSGDGGDGGSSGNPVDGGSQQSKGPAMGFSKSAGGGVAMAEKPFPGGFPAPTHETPGMYAGIEGQSSVCGSGDKVFLTLDGFVGKAAFPGAPFVDYPNDYTLLVINKASHETVATVPLEDKTVYDKTLPNGGGAAVRSGYINVVVPLSRDNDPTDYPKDLYDLRCLLVLKPSRVAEFTEGQGVLRGQRPIPVVPANILHIPTHRKDVPDCPVTKIKEVKGDNENMEKAVALPDLPKN